MQQSFSGEHSCPVLQWNHIAMIDPDPLSTTVHDRWQLLIGPDYWKVTGHMHNSGNSCVDVCMPMFAYVRVEGEVMIASFQPDSK